MKKALWALSAMALIGFGMTACEEEDLGNGGSTLPAVTDSWDKCGEDLPDPNNPGKAATQKVEAYDASGNKVHACSSYDECADEGFVFKKDAKSDVASCVYDILYNGGYCRTNNDCEDEEATCNADHQCEVGGEETFKFVRIDDGSEDIYSGDWDAVKGCAKGTSNGKSICHNDPGADIDAIVLTKANGDGPFYAGDVYDYHFAIAAANVVYNKNNKDEYKDGPKLATNPLNILGAPKSLIDYGTANAKCNLYIDENTACFGDGSVQCETRPYVSLGGPGGYIIVEMDEGQSIEAGDTLDILEVGDCECQQTNDAEGCGSRPAVADALKVYISVSDSMSGDWKVLLDEATAPQKGVVSIPITETMFN